jgi:hypothetical protein
VHRLGWAALTIALAAVLALIGCGTPGAPLPPSLKLPDPVTDLSATRTGDQVTLTWTMPKKNTDKLLLKGNVPIRVCRKEGAGTCNQAGGQLMMAPGSDGVYTEALPQPFTPGAPRALTYFVELTNHNGRSAGLSNDAVVLAGEAPGPVASLTAQVRKDGIVLRWRPDHSASPEPAPTAIRLHRKLLTPPAAKPQQGPLAPPPEPVEKDLLVESGARTGRVLDKDIRFGQVYEYRIQRVARIVVDGQTQELAGELSAPIRVEALDTFPPAVPTGLAAVATAGDAGTEPSIDLSWQPVTDPDLAGYIVYRREAGGEWQRISPAQPIVPPAYHDAPVQPGHTYQYSVSAVDQGGHQSDRSAETEESVPQP